MQEPLVVANKYNKTIRFLKAHKQINPNYPILVRDRVARKLANVASRLSKGLYLQIDSGHRNLETQKALWRNRYNQFKHQNRASSPAKIYKMTHSLVFDPSNGVPPHSTGGAVDIALQNETGEEINLSAPFKKFYDEPKLMSNKISKSAQKLRLLINKLMLDEEFAPNEREYWHFSYGDKTWARYYNKKAFYNQISVPESLKYSFIIRSRIKLIRLFWRIVNNLLRKETNY